MAGKICGVYKITNTANDKIYVGSSKDIIRRWKQHKDELNKKIHGNVHLQRAWDLYGEQNFKFEILEECLPNIQFEKEQFYLNELDPFDSNGYNIVRQISKEHMSDNYMIKTCNRCGSSYNTFSHLSKYCDMCKEQINKERREQFESDRYWMQDTSGCYEIMYDGYEDADDFWESNF